MRASDAAKRESVGPNAKERAKEGECILCGARDHTYVSSVPSCKYVQAHFERISRRALSLALTDAAASLAQPQGQAGARVLAERLGGDVVEE